MPSHITPSLWFDGRAEEAANFYTSVFKNSRINHIQRFPEGAGVEVQGQQPGSVMVVGFELNGQSFTALNGGPQFHFSPAISFQIACADQTEVDHYWEKLTEEGDATKQKCGWVEDKFGISWQIVPKALIEMISDPDPVKSQRTFKAMMGMKRLDIAALQVAYNNEGTDSSLGTPER